MKRSLPTEASFLRWPFNERRDLTPIQPPLPELLSFVWQYTHEPPLGMHAIPRLYTDMYNACQDGTLWKLWVLTQLNLDRDSIHKIVLLLVELHLTFFVCHVCREEDKVWPFRTMSPRYCRMRTKCEDASLFCSKCITCCKICQWACCDMCLLQYPESGVTGYREACGTGQYITLINCDECSSWICDSRNVIKRPI